MTATRHQKRSNLFLLRVWREEDAGGISLWCGRLQRTVNGEEHEFRGLDGLAALLAGVLDGHSPGAAPPPRTEQAGPPGQ